MKLVFALATALFAANDPAFLIWKVADLQHYEEMLRAKVGQTTRQTSGFLTSMVMPSLSFFATEQVWQKLTIR